MASTTSENSSHNADEAHLEEDIGPSRFSALIQSITEDINIKDEFLDGSSSEDEDLEEYAVDARKSLDNDELTEMTERRTTRTTVNKLLKKEEKAKGEEPKLVNGSNKACPQLATLEDLDDESSTSDADE